MFFGWRMVGVAFGAQFVASGLGFYALPRLLVPLADEFAQGERVAVAMLAAAMSLAGLVVSPLVGRAIALFPLHAVLTAGALVMAVGFAFASRVGTLWQLVCIYAVAVPIGVTALGNIGANALVANWFDRRRALALGISQFGLSIAGAAVPFFIGWTLVQGGWRATYLWFAAIALATAPVVWVATTGRPHDRGLQPDGDPAPEAGLESRLVPAVMSLGEALRDRALWIVGIAAGLAFAAITGILQNLHAFATDAGHEPARADVVLATLAVGAAFGKILFGLLGVGIGERAAFATSIVSQGLALALLPMAKTSLALLVAVTLLFGLALGGVMPTLAALLARMYGSAQFGPVLGYVGPMLIPFQMTGAPIAAWVYDRTGSYDAAIYGFVVTSAVAALTLTLLRVPGAPPPRAR